MEPVSNLGRFGRVLLIVVGIILLCIGIYLTIENKNPDNAVECEATITGFKTEDTNTVMGDNTGTLVTYKVGRKQYTDIELGQYESSWKVGDKIVIYYLTNNPMDITTKTITYGGWIVIIMSLPFLIIGIYTILSVRRRSAKTPEEIAEDEERTTAGKLKYKVSSIVIPLAGGIPCCMISVILSYLEHSPIPALLFFILGVCAVAVGIRSIVVYFIIKHRRRRAAAVNP